MKKYLIPAALLIGAVCSAKAQLTLTADGLRSSADLRLLYVEVDCGDLGYRDTAASVEEFFNSAVKTMATALQ